MPRGKFFKKLREASDISLIDIALRARALSGDHNGYRLGISAVSEMEEEEDETDEKEKHRSIDRWGGGAEFSGF